MRFYFRQGIVDRTMHELIVIVRYSKDCRRMIPKRLLKINMSRFAANIMEKCFSRIAKSFCLIMVLILAVCFCSVLHADDQNMHINEDIEKYLPKNMEELRNIKQNVVFKLDDYNKYPRRLLGYILDVIEDYEASEKKFSTSFFVSEVDLNSDSKKDYIFVVSSSLCARICPMTIAVSYKNGPHELAYDPGFGQNLKVVVLPTKNENHNDILMIDLRGWFKVLRFYDGWYKLYLKKDLSD